MGWSDVTSVVPYGPRLIRHRRMLNSYLYRKRTEDYHPIQLKASRLALQQLLQTPDNYRDIFTQLRIPLNTLKSIRLKLGQV
jgi:cytochrome P450